MQVYRQVELALQGKDELSRRRGAHQARHVLDAKDVRAGVDQLLG